MPDNSQHSEPDLEAEVIGSFGDTDDPVFQKLVSTCLRVLQDVHLIHGELQISTGHLMHKEEPWSLVLLVIHGMEVIEGDFADATEALLIQRAPLVTWLIDMEKTSGIVISGQYTNDMPIESVTA